MLLGLGHDHAQDTVLEVGSDCILVDACGEVKATRELANASLSKPVLSLVGWLLDLLVIGVLDNFVGLRLGLVFNGGLVAVPASIALGDGAGRGVALDRTIGGSASSVSAFDLAANEHGLRLGELNVDIVLAHAREFAVQLVYLTSLAHIKLGLPVLKPGATTLAAISTTLSRVVVEVIKEAEKGVEGGVIGGVVEVAWEESHGADLVGRRMERGDVLEVA